MSSKSISFSIQGEFVTSFGRDKLFQQHDLKGAIHFLTGCLQSDELSEKEIEQMAYDILNGRAKVVGTYPNDNYHFEYIEKQKDANDISDAITECYQQLENAELISKKFAFIESFLTEQYPSIAERMNNLYDETYDEPLFETKTDECSYQDAMLNSFMERMKTDTDDDYGWLEPNGTFHPVEWGEHENWAQNYAKDNMSHDDWFQASTPSENSIIGVITTYGDYLVKQGWILLHNPAQGIALITKSPDKPMTKHQKEFLYQYYIDRNQHKTANEIWKENTEEY